MLHKDRGANIITPGGRYLRGTTSRRSWHWSEPTLLLTVHLYVPEYSVVAFFTVITEEVISMKREMGQRETHVYRTAETAVKASPARPDSPGKSERLKLGAEPTPGRQDTCRSPEGKPLRSSSFVQ